MITQILRALVYMHTNKVVHRDLKPANIMLVDTSGSLEVKLVDFGFSYIQNKDGEKMKCGTPEYMAPEIVKKETYNEKIDIWALGVIAYKLLTGEAPFPGETKEEVYEKIKKSDPVYTGKMFEKVNTGAIKFLKRALT